MIDFDANYEVISFGTTPTKNGGIMGKMQIKHTVSNDVLNCVLWEETLNRLGETMFRAGNIIKLITASFNEQYKNCLITSAKLIEEGITGLDEKQTEDCFCKLIQYIDKIDNKDLKEFVSKLIFENEEDFKTKPAAVSMHHNYCGGLLEHTVECLDILDTVMKTVYKKIDKDNAIAAVTLHDFGKIYEYEYNKETGVITCSKEFLNDWISHSQYGFSICMNAGFKDVAKMIAAHHGRSDWGSLIDLSTKDLEPEYYLVHHIDDLSAKFGKVKANNLKQEQ